MPMTTLERIEARIAAADALPQDDREGLLLLLKELREEVQGLSDTDAARRVASYTELSVDEATRAETDEGLLEHALQGLRQSTERFRANHPRVASLADDIAGTLSRMGLG